MRLLVRHQAGYHHASPVDYAIRVLRLSPLAYEGLAVRRYPSTAAASTTRNWVFSRPPYRLTPRRP